MSTTTTTNKAQLRDVAKAYSSCEYKKRKEKEKESSGGRWRWRAALRSNPLSLDFVRSELLKFSNLHLHLHLHITLEFVLVLDLVVFVFPCLSLSAPTRAKQIFFIIKNGFQLFSFLLSLSKKPHTHVEN